MAGPLILNSPDPPSPTVPVVATPTVVVVQPISPEINRLLATREPIEESVGPKVSPTSDDPLVKARASIAATLKTTLITLLVLVPILILTMITLLSGFLSIIPALRDGQATIDRIATVGSLQVGLGMFFGFLCLYFGFMMTWIGIEAAYKLDASGESQSGSKATLSLASASPGLLFGLAGVVLIAASLHKELRFEEHGGAAGYNDDQLPPGYNPPKSVKVRGSDKKDPDTAVSDIPGNKE